MAHIPSGDSDNLPSYGEVILNITKKYKKIIVGILSAHTHNDQFELVRSQEHCFMKFVTLFQYIPHSTCSVSDTVCRPA